MGQGQEAQQRCDLTADTAPGRHRLGGDGLLRFRGHWYTLANPAGPVKPETDQGGILQRFRCAWVAVLRLWSPSWIPE